MAQNFFDQFDAGRNAAPPAGQNFFDQFDAGGPAEPPTEPLGRVEQHDFGDAYRGPDGNLIAINPATDVVRDGMVYPRGAAPNTRTESGLTREVRELARNIRTESKPDNVLAGGLDTAANWLDWTPEPGSADTLAPLGGAAVGTIGLGVFGRPHGSTLGVFGGRLEGGNVPRAPVDAGGGGAAIPPADAAAYQIFADTMTRGGRTVPEAEADLARIRESGRFHSSGNAQNVTALLDIDPSLMRLAGSVARQSPEAASDIGQFIRARQTGHTPEGVDPAAMAERGLPTRPPFTDPLTGAQAARQLGRSFDTADKYPVPMGVMDRTRDAMRRAFLISDADYHGHGLTGLRTEQIILRTARQKADANYQNAYAAGQSVNLRDAITPVFERYMARAAVEEAPVVENTIKRIQGMFRAGHIELKQFDRTKRAVDDIIKKYLNRTDKSGVHLGGVLNDLKNELLAAVDAVPVAGSAYRAAREAYSSDMDMLNALRMGRDSLKDASEVSADNFLGLKTEGERELFRLGQIDSVTARGMDKSRAHDFTQVFKTPRVEALLTVTIPRSKEAGAVFADRPQRFGRYVDSQSRMIEARNAAQGGSTTMRNAADDAALETLQAVALGQVKNLRQALRGSQSAWEFMERTLELAIDKAFGLRAEVNKALARMLTTADEQQQAAILRSVAQRMPPSRMERFNQIMTDYAQTAEKGGPAALRAQITDQEEPPSSQ